MPTNIANRRLLRGVRLAEGATVSQPVDLVIQDGLIAQLGPSGQVRADDVATIEQLDGWLVTPAPAEPHAHLDKALTADRVINPRGDLDGAVEQWMAVDSATRYGDLAQRALRTLRLQTAAGATAVRTHVDTGAAGGLEPTRTLLALRDQVAPLVTLQVFPSFGLPIAGPAGTETRRLLDQAIELGIDGIGGAPNLDGDPTAALNVILRTAAEAGLPLDLHLDETLDPRHFLLESLADQAGSLGVAVTVDHVCSLAIQPAERRRRTAQALAQAGVVVVSLPQTNLYLQGRQSRSPVARGITAVRDLLDAGVTVAGGGDNIVDAFNAVGRADPLETASLLVAGAHVTIAEALGAISGGARAALGLAPVTLTVGSPADLLVARAANPQELVALAPADRIVFKAGQVVARTSTKVEFAPLPDLPGGGRWT